MLSVAVVAARHRNADLIWLGGRGRAEKASRGSGRIGMGMGIGMGKQKSGCALHTTVVAGFFWWRGGKAEIVLEFVALVEN